MIREKGHAVAFIPARSGSRSIPFKNIKLLAGKPLVQWTIEAAVAATCIDEVFVGTDSSMIRDVIHALGLSKVTVVGRSPETATDQASTESALIEFCEAHQFDHVFLIQATSPLLSAEDLDAAWGQYEAGPYTSMLSVARQKRFVWGLSNGIGRPVNYDPQNRPRRQDFGGLLVENGAFYLSPRKEILVTRCRISGDIGLFEMGPESYLELDEPEDWALVESLLRSHLTANLKSGVERDIRLLVTDCDGVLTDGGMYYSAAGEEFKLFNTVDGKGVERLREHGVDVAILTGEISEIIVRRAEKLNIDKVYLGIKEKASALRKLAEECNVDLKQVAYIGDDVNDIPAIELVGLSACPITAQKPVKATVDMVLSQAGGRGALREFSEIIIHRKLQSY